MRNRPKISLPPETIAKVKQLVIHDANDILAFNKPSGLAAQTRGNRGENLDHWLWAFARSNGKRPRLVHRIDVGTSGVIIAARTKPAAAFLSAQFAQRKVKKRYVALVSGQLPDQTQGRCEIALLTRGRKSFASTIDNGADAARTDWQIQARAGNFAWVIARPYTGRMHQIRAHLAALRMPIIGDAMYGDNSHGAGRLMLHAEHLEVRAPDGEIVSLSAPVPTEFTAFWESCLDATRA